MLTLADVEAARHRIGRHLRRTPCVPSEVLSERVGASIHLKFECLQRTGSFKERGALNRLLQLSAVERERGVVAASAGNHAQAVVHHATRLGIASTVVMPRHAAIGKIAATERRGGTVLLHGESFDEALARALEIADREGKTFVHAFDDSQVIAGQGTLALELLDEGIPLDAVVVPIGGGGLVSGVGVVLEAVDPRIEVIGVEPETCASMLASRRAGHPVALGSGASIADGLAVKAPGPITFEIANRVLDDLVTVSEEEIANAILVLLEVEKTMTEGAGAAALAEVGPIEHGRERLRGKNVVLPLTGGNIDVNVLSRIIDRGLAKDGRLAKLRLFVPDRPGSLAAASRLLAEAGANVLDIFHLRTFAPTAVGQVALDFVLETRGADHLREILARLERDGLHAESR